jgi:mono/diheme cytochrome c family protein
VARRFALGLAALALVAAGCGGGDGAEEGAPPQATMTAPPGGDQAGASVFASAGCGSCHTLEEAGTTGTIGPALDGANLSVDAAAQQVRNGGGGMPAFSDQLSDEQIQQVAEFVAEASQS